MTALERAAQAPIKKLIPYLGYGEKNNASDLWNMNTYGSGNYTFIAKYFDDLYRKGYHFYGGILQAQPWCDMTVDWAMCQAFGHELGRQVIYQPLNSVGAGCIWSAKYYQSKKAWIPRNGNPLPGDQIFFGKPGAESHTGIVESVTSSTVNTIEGNCSNKLLRRSYSRSSGNISGYGRPNYALVAHLFTDKTSGIDETISNTQVSETEKEYQKALDEVNEHLKQFESVMSTIVGDNIGQEEIEEDTPLSDYGSTQWFTNFVDSYEDLLQEYNKNLDKINSFAFYYLKDNPFKISNIVTINVKNTIPRPEQQQNGIGYLWCKMFNLVYTADQLSFLNQYNKQYEIACYYGYQQAVSFYEKMKDNLTNQFGEALVKQDLISMWNICFNLLQVKIYLLYFYTFGYITRSLKSGISEEAEDNDINYSYNRIGVSYNFGKANEDYQKFLEQARLQTEIFNNNLYLSEEYIQPKILYWLTIIENVNREYSLFQEALFSYSGAIAGYQDEYNQKLDKLKEQSKLTPIQVDWRELIYQMARDYFDYYQNPNYDYQSMLLAANKNILKKNGTTGYEVFYTDLLGFWRELYYNPLLEKNDYDISNIFSGANSLTIDDFNPETNWRKIVSERPSQLNYWFDLTEGYGELAKYTISAIGDRLKATKDSAVEALYYKDTPNIIYYEQNDIPKVENDGYNSYTYFQLGGPMLDVYTMSSQGKTAIDLLQDQLYKFAFCVENISITTLPIYTLKPNYRILIKSEIQGLSGEYIIDKFSIPFVYNGTMTINAIKAVPYIGING